MKKGAIIVLLGAISCALGVPAVTNVNSTDNSQQNDNAVFPPSTRIVGGFEIPIEQAPWIVSVLRWHRHHCGGSIISATRILTAAHCVANSVASDLAVRAGATYTNAGGHVVQVARIHRHTQFNARTYENDIATMWLAGPLAMGSRVAVIRLPAHGSFIDTGAVASTAGWGALRENGPNAESLRRVFLPIVMQVRCNQYYRGRITDGMVCAGHLPNGGRDTCQGDSGGPLWLNGLLVGVSSWGEGCGRPNRPGVFVRVPYYRRWIDQHV